MSLTHVSPSQIQTYTNCPRLWAFQKLEGIKAPSTGAQNVGKAIHAAIELYQKTGRIDPCYKEFVEKFADVVATPKTCNLFIEHSIEFPIEPDADKDSLKMKGIIDRFVLEGKNLTISDIKTTSHFKYAKTSEELLTNIQMITYAYWAWEFYPQKIDELTIQHINIRKNNPDIKIVSAQIDYPTTYAGFIDIRDKAREMNNVAKQKPDVYSINGNADHCKAYGGCYFRDRCPEAGGVPMKNSELLGIKKADEIFEKVNNTPTVGLVVPIQSIIPPDGKLSTKIADPVADPKPAKHKISLQFNTKKRKIALISAICEDGIPLNGIDFHEWVAPHLHKFNTEHNTVDYRCIDYGKGTGLLQAYWRTISDTFPDVLILSQRHPDWEIFWAVAKSHYVVFRGVIG